MLSRSGIIGLFQRFLRSRSGNVAIVSAIVMPALVGFCGLGCEVGYWYYRQRDLQGAADIAAYDATVVLRSGASSAQVSQTASADAASNGWRSAIGTITVNTPPASGAYQNASSVEVLLTETEPRYFTGLFNNAPVTVSVRGVATYISNGPACMLGLDKSMSGTVDFWGNATAVFDNCNINSNSLAADSFKVGGSAVISAPCVSSSGGAEVVATLTLTSCNGVTTNAPATPDPYASVPAPMIPANCTNPPRNGPMSPGKYCNGLTLQGAVNLSPGVYVIDGGTFKVNANANVTGDGVMFYLTNGATIQFNGNAQMNLSAPTNGTYAGLLFFGDRTQPYANNTLNGNDTSIMTGAAYFPSQEIDFLGNFSGNNGCMQIVADRIYYTGNGTFHTNCAGTGMKTINTPGAVSVVE